ncbi:hypothetical protein EV132_101173 [Rhizobium sullae]|uniref:Uncharacterized protein n=2 Tax=Rhizobium sullae TaxID=50338 RepID=A0A4R3QGF0_RHISU|nr:hypothetical protein EV132_101173 [Rhizobium sullae]
MVAGWLREHALGPPPPGTVVAGLSRGEDIRTVGDMAADLIMCSWMGPQRLLLGSHGQIPPPAKAPAGLARVL